MNRSFRSQYRQALRHRGATLLLGILIGLFALQSARALTTPVPGDTVAPALSVPGLNQAVGGRAFQAGLVAFEQEEYTLARRQWVPMARLGHAESQFYMGLLHDVGVGIRPDARQAIRWYRLAAEQGLPEAQQKLALAYARGEGVARDISRALRWWLRAAHQGNTDSQYNLGVIYALGHDGIARDPHRAAHWWRQAAIGGDPMAQYNLGTFYANGEAGQTDLCQALHWWRKSQRNGLPQADDALAALRHRFDSEHCQVTGR
ncbi:MAG: tetratricopeptide repeat protein [Thiohalophilus sp.]